MRPFVTLIGILLFAPGLSASDAKGDWKNLFSRDLKDWSRSGSGKNPWRVSANQSLLCDPASESLASATDFFDGTLKFEYRFRPTEQKAGYRASLGVRQNLGGGGCKIALGEGCGTMTTVYQGSSDRQKSAELKPAASPARDIGDWNTVKVHLLGRKVRVWINDREMPGFDNSDTRGFLTFEAEGWEIEFRRVEWKESK